ncbi:MAG: hypothetical protein AB7O98_01020 [Hyphomonadaceae bacterium]
MSEELFRDYWWLMFPVFGMIMAAWGMASEGRRENAKLRRWERDLERRP